MIEDASGWVAAVAAVVAAGLVAWQSYETRRSAQASESAVETANKALVFGQQQAAEAVRARIDAATPVISVLLAPEVDWPPLEPSMALGGEPNPLRQGLQPEPMLMPRDGNRQLMVRARVELINASDRTVQLSVHSLFTGDAMTPLSSPLVLGPRESVSAWCAATHTLGEWIDVYKARARADVGYTSDEVVATVVYLDPVDTGVNDRWELIIGGTPVTRVDDLSDGWLLIPEPRPLSGEPGAIGTGPVIRQRTYYLSKVRNQPLD